MYSATACVLDFQDETLVPLEQASVKDLQKCASFEGLGRNNFRVQMLISAESLTQREQNLLIGKLLARGYTAVDKTDPTWIMPV